MTILKRPRFGELPRSGSGQDQQAPWEPIAKDLKANPGKWAVVAVKENANQAGQTAHNIRHGKIRAFSAPAGGVFEATTRAENVWARWLPDGHPR